MTFRLTAATAVTAAFVPFAALAQADSAKVDALFDALLMPQMVAVMQTEGVDYGAQIAEDLFPGRTADDWTDVVAEIYAPEAMTEAFKDGLTTALAAADIDAITAFYTSDLGQEIVGLELAARRALMDDDIETASQAAAAEALIDETPRARQMQAFVDANSLIEANVVGALNASYAFYQGLRDGGSLPGDLTEEQMLDTVWGQEPEIRNNTTEWVYGYLFLAFDPLSDEDIDAYIDFSASDVGQDFNTAMFAAFDGVYNDISGALGRAAAVYMIGEDL